MGYNTQINNLNIKIASAHTTPRVPRNNTALILESFHLMKPHGLCQPRASAVRTAQRSFNDFCPFLHKKNEKVKRKKEKKGSRTQEHQHYTSMAHCDVCPSAPCQHTMGQELSQDPECCTSVPGSPEGAAGAPNVPRQRLGLDHKHGANPLLQFTNCFFYVGLSVLRISVSCRMTSSASTCSDFLKESGLSFYVSILS